MPLSRPNHRGLAQKLPPAQNQKVPRQAIKIKLLGQRHGVVQLLIIRMVAMEPLPVQTIHRAPLRLHNSVLLLPSNNARQV
jgi:hypothetical protein